MRGILIIIVFISTLIGYGQERSNFTILSEDSTMFLLKIDGVLQMDSAWYNVKITGIKDQSHSIQLTLIDHRDTIVEKALYFQEMNIESTMKLVSQNGIYKLRYFGEVSMGAAPVQDDQIVLEYRAKGSSKNVIPSTNISEMSKVEAYSYQLQNNTSAQVLNSQPTFVGTNTESTAIDLVTSSEINDSIALDSLTFPLDTNRVYEPEILELVYNYKGEKGCSFPDFELEELVETINASSFSNQKLKLAKNGVRDNCLTSLQVEKIANTLEFEDDKLNFIKFAYQFTYDRENYKKLMNMLHFEHTRSSFIEFLNT
ncbi:MAG: DUF4476 domain-containing protein [Flavobacteriales bacterium]|nr:DUF4476 domain-containing protein [Flavobacteriales bacterium]